MIPQADCPRAGTVKPAGPFGGNSQSGKVAKHGTQSGYVMHRRHGQTACQPCKDAHAAYVRASTTDYTPGGHD